MALLDWRNTPTKGIGTSPAQHLLGCRCRTLLPLVESLLKPCYDTGGDIRAVAGAKHGLQHYYDRAATPLKAITPGEMVPIKLPGQETESKNLYRKGCQQDLCSKGGRHRVQAQPQTHREQMNYQFPSLTFQKLMRLCQHLLRTAKPNPPSSKTPATDGNNGLHRSNRTRWAPAWHNDSAVFRN